MAVRFPKSVKFPKGMKPVVKKYAEKIARLAQQTVAKVTGVDKPQWSFDTEPLGAGSWGVVWPLTDKRFILKVTADPTEGPVVATIMSEPALHNHMAIVHYFALRQLPEGVTFRNRDFPLYVIVAERLVHSSQASALMDPDDDKQYDANYRFVRMLANLQLAARELVQERARKRPRPWIEEQLVENWTDKVNALGDGPLEDFIWQFYDITRPEIRNERGDFVEYGDGGVLADIHFTTTSESVSWTGQISASS